MKGFLFAATEGSYKRNVLLFNLEDAFEFLDSVLHFRNLKCVEMNCSKKGKSPFNCSCLSEAGVSFRNYFVLRFGNHWFAVNVLQKTGAQSTHTSK